MKQAYYARPKSIYGTPQEARDEYTIRGMGYEPVDFKKKEIQAAARSEGMEVFKPLVQRANALFFRSFVDGFISAGVAQEIQWAEEAGLPVVELPSLKRQRYLDVEDTREYLEELGER